jgi:hypothetical protein
MRKKKKLSVRTDDMRAYTLSILLAEASKRGWNKPANYDGSFEVPEQEEFQENEEEGVKEVVEATSFTSEDVHGGKEDTKSVLDSPSCTDNGEQEKKISDKKGANGKGAQSKDDRKAALIKERVEILSKNERTDALVKYIRDLLKKQEGDEHIALSQNWDKKAIVRDLATGNIAHLLEDKESLTGTREILLFLDLSGSFESIRPIVREVMQALSATGYAVTVMDCGNGFNYESSLTVDQGDDYYHTRPRLMRLVEGTRARVHKYFTSPSIEDAIKLCNNAAFSIVFADYDGFSSIARVAAGCAEGNAPFFFDFDYRYDEPVEHDWVDEEWSTYQPEDKWITRFKYYFDSGY